MIICSIFALLRTILAFCVYRYFGWISNLYNNICKISETYLSKHLTFRKLLLGDI